MGSISPNGSTRRYEAIVVIGEAVGEQPTTMEGLTALCSTGATVAIVGREQTCDLATRLSGFDPGAGALLFAAAFDPRCVIVDRSGSTTVQRVPRAGAGRPRGPGRIDGSLADWLAGQLRARGLRAHDAVATGDGPAPLDLAALPAGLAIAPGPVADLVADQLARRQRGEQPWVAPEVGWEVVREGFDVNRLRVNGALFTLADGLIGTSGAPLASHPGLHRWVVAAGVYVGDGPETHLVTLPVAMQLPAAMAAEPHLRRVLDLRTGTLHEEIGTEGGLVTSVRFSSLARPGTTVFRAHGPDAGQDGPLLLPPADDPPLDHGADGEVPWMRVAGTPGGAVTAATDVRRSVPGGHVVDRVAVYVASPDKVPAAEEAVGPARQAAGAGFDVLLAEQRAAWAARWEDADIVISGDHRLQRATRYALFHLMGSAGDQGEAAVGARGLTGTSYRGHVFWDADTLTLPFLAATHPASARAMLEYRIRRLPVARAIARQFRRQGARFPWESAYTGRDVTPLSARDRTGHMVPIRTGLLEEHIVAQVAWAASCYVDWTGDQAFARGPGLELLIETARYWASRVRHTANGGHIFGVIGPDEYHEPVDDNAFTNVMARWNLRRAADEVAAVDPDDAVAAEAARWRSIADGLVDGYDPSTGIYEQFAGFHRLEPLIIRDVAPRRPITADLLLGARRVEGAQIIKQADVLMLHHLVPEAVEPGSLVPNLDYYEPRTAHGSSLSPGIHAALFARAGRFDQALDALRIATEMDLEDLTDTTAGGLHLATMGSVWQAFAFGFAGLRPRLGRLVVDPRLPTDWTALEIRVRFHGQRVIVHIEHDRLQIDGDGPTPLTVDGIDYTLARGTLTLRRRGHAWKEIA